MSTVALIDGDVLAYHSCRPRGKNREEGTILMKLDEDGRKIHPEYTRKEDAKYLMQSWDNFKRKLDATMKKVYCDEFMMAVGGRDNFRLNMFPDYKNNRHRNPKKQNKFVPMIRQLAVREGLAVFADYREADDYIRTWAIECARTGREYIVCTIDKDLRCIPGKYYNMMKEEMETITEHEAMRLYYEQLIMGDPTDNIPGLPGVGPKTARSLLLRCETKKEYRKEVMALYRSFYDDEWKDYLLSNGKLIHIQRHLNDFFTLENW